MQATTHNNSVEKAFAILEFLGDSRRRWNISELSRRLGMPKSTTHVLVTTLERLGYITREGGKRNYTASVHFYGERCSAGRPTSIEQRALPHMQALSEQTGLTVHLAVLDKLQGLYVQKVNGPAGYSFDTYVGKRMNLHCTAVGKILLAHGGDEVAEQLLSRGRLARHTENTIASGAALRLEIQKVRSRNYAIDDQEEELDVRCMAVPIFDHMGRFVAALSATGTVNQITEHVTQSLLRHLRLAANGIVSVPACAGLQVTSLAAGVVG